MVSPPSMFCPYKLQLITIDDSFYATQNMTIEQLTYRVGRRGCTNNWDTVSVNFLNIWDHGFKDPGSRNSVILVYKWYVLYCMYFHI